MNPSQNNNQVILRQFHALQPYEKTFQAMQAFTATRNMQTPDEIWLLQHEAVLTQGQAGKPEHIIATTQLPIVQSDRGGQVTWHGPGQLVVYFLLDLKRLGWHVRDLVNYAENAMIAVLAQFGIVAYAKANAPGVYVNAEKIGSLGFKIKRGCSYHGLSLNVNCSLDGFNLINPCGYADLRMIRMQDCCSQIVTIEGICQAFVNYICQSATFSSVTLKYDSPLLLHPKMN